MGSIAAANQFRAGTLQSLQVTLGAGATQVTQVVLFVRQVIIQNNAGHSCRVADFNVSSSRGALIAGGGGVPASAGSINLGQFNNYGEVDLSSIWIFGTQNDVIDVLFVI